MRCDAGNSYQSIYDVLLKRWEWLSLGRETVERREFIKIVCGLVGTWPIVAYAQQVGELRRIGGTRRGCDGLEFVDGCFCHPPARTRLDHGRDYRCRLSLGRGKLRACERFHGRIPAPKRRRDCHIWSRRHCGTAGDNDHSYRPSCSVRSWCWFACKPTGRQRYRNLDPTVRTY